MKYEVSVANINKDGMCSVILELDDKIQDFFDMLQNQDAMLIPDEGQTYGQLLFSTLMILAGECCEADNIVTTDENEVYDFDAFKSVLKEHDGFENVSEAQFETLWNHVKPFVKKRYVTWG